MVNNVNKYKYENENNYCCYATFRRIIFIIIIKNVVSYITYND